MAMAVDNRQQSQLGGMPMDSFRYPAPHFTNPWVPASGTSSSQMYPTSLAPTSGVEQQLSRPTAISMPFAGGALPATTIGADASRSYPQQYATSTSPSSYAATTTSSYPMDYKYAYQDARRSSHPSVASALFDPQLDKVRQSSMIDMNDRMNTSQAQRNSFSEAVDASRGMIAMSQSDITPRNIYGNQNPRNSTDSYGFPSTHSSHSSISSASGYYGGGYSNGSVGDHSSVTDYSSASESVDMNPRTLPRPAALVGGSLPPAPQSMMGQFSSKVSSSSQKKHKCKICDKRFTRPSSLQTHMYSHTGEKPFACEVEGCGRHFSVVSNLRRHRKVHKGEGQDHPSPDDSLSGA